MKELFIPKASIRDGLEVRHPPQIANVPIEQLVG
jgi:hypothetical protein